jgi:hypothetical protein
MTDKGVAHASDIHAKASVAREEAAHLLENNCPVPTVAPPLTTLMSCEVPIGVCFSMRIDISSKTRSR